MDADVSVFDQEGSACMIDLPRRHWPGFLAFPVNRNRSSEAGGLADEMWDHMEQTCDWACLEPAWRLGDVFQGSLNP